MLNDAIAPKLDPIRQRPDGCAMSGNCSSSCGTSSLVIQRACGPLFGYSVSRSPGYVKATTVAAMSIRWIRLSSTVFIDAYSRKSPPSCTTSNGYEVAVPNRAGR